MFHSKWRLRANKICTGIHLANQDEHDLWNPCYGRLFEEWKENFIYEEADDLEVLMECFSTRIAETPEGDDRPILSNEGECQIEDYSLWLKEAKKKRMEVKAHSPLERYGWFPAGYTSNTGVRTSSHSRETTFSHSEARVD